VPLWFSNPCDADFQDGYFLLRIGGTNRFAISGLLDGQAWAADEYGTAQGSPDDIVKLVSVFREVWCIGSESTEIFINTGAAAFPFERSNNVFIQTGCSATSSVVKYSDGLIWLSKTKDGGAQVVRTRGYQVMPVSPAWWDEEISKYPVIDDATAYYYRIAGHGFYVLQFPTEGVTWCYDVLTGAWAELASHDGRGLIRHRSSAHMFYKGKHYIGEYDRPCINELTFETHSDANGIDGEPWPLVTLRSCQPLAEKNDSHQTSFAELEILTEPATGNPPDASTNEVIWSLRYSDDGGFTWSDYMDCGAGREGQYDTRVFWECLVSGRRRVFEVSSSSPLKRVILGAIARAKAGLS
jgi:hypothetical protein